MPITALISTVPGAIATLKGYMLSVASVTAVSNVSVYMGKEATEGQLAYNFMMIGDYHNGIPVAPDSMVWNAIPGAAHLIGESYALQACIACWAGGYDPLPRLTDAYALLDGLHQQVRTDLGGSGQLSPSGSWGEMRSTMAEFGTVGTGWGVALDIELFVINGQISG
jgi:hypothetical protein